MKNIKINEGRRPAIHSETLFSQRKIFLTLLELGTSTAGPILEKSGLQNSVVHMTLNKLIERGFVTFVKEGKRNHYQAANPNHIIDFINEKKERFQEILPAHKYAQKFSISGTQKSLIFVEFVSILPTIL